MVRSAREEAEYATEVALMWLRKATVWTERANEQEEKVNEQEGQKTVARYRGYAALWQIRNRSQI